MKNEILSNLSKSYCTSTFKVDSRIIENNYRCGNKGLGPAQLNKIQAHTRKAMRRREPISIY